MRILILGGGLVATLLSSPAHAGWIQTFGQSERCVTLGGACTAKEGDLGSIYHNPAASADFDGVVIGGNVRILDTTHVDLIDTGGKHAIDRSNTENKVVFAPTLAGFAPVGKNVTVGLALGAPFAITADWPNRDGIHRYNMSDQSLFVLDVSPSVAVRASDRLTLGAALNVVAFKQLRTETLIPQSFGAALPPALGGAGAVIPTPPTSPVIGSITIQTNGDIGFGIPPGKLDTSFKEFAVTLGAQYRVSDRVRVGATFRSKTKMTWDGALTLDLTPAGIGKQVTTFKTAIDMPAHVQVGTEIAAIPNKLNLSFDLQWTNWADTRGIGKPLVIAVAEPLLGFVRDIEVDYKARNTLTLRTGAEFKLNRRWSLLSGYAFDQSIFADDRVDILTYDSNRHLLSFGVQYDGRRDDTGRGWTITGGFHATLYETRTIAAGQSRNLGGLSLPNLVDADTLGFTASREPFSYGGAILAGGLSFQYSFGKRK